MKRKQQIEKIDKIIARLQIISGTANRPMCYDEILFVMDDVINDLAALKMLELRED